MEESSGPRSPSSPSPPSPKRQRVAEVAAPAPPAETDKLLSLPTKILDRILKRIPFATLIRTSLLSHAWRHRWESVADLDIDLPPSASARALWRCAAPVHGFRARVAARGNRCRRFYRVARWLRALARKLVEELTLEFDGFLGKPPVLLGPALFSCAALVRLELCHCRVPPAPPGFPGFPDLISLVLVHVALLFEGRGGGAQAQLEHLIAAEAPERGVLGFTKPLGGDADAVEKWFIRAPNLRNLVIITNYADDGCWIAEEELPQLEKASIHIDCLIRTPDFIDILRWIASVDILWLHTNSNLCTVNPLKGITWKFKNLRKAELNITFGRFPSFMSIVSLLRCAPHIEHLDIRAEDTERLAGEFQIDEEFLNSETSDGLFSTLKSVSLSGIKNCSNQMCFMKFVLSKAKSLRHFFVSFDPGESNESYNQACRKLGKCKIASSEEEEEKEASPTPAAAAAATTTDKLLSLPAKLLDRVFMRVPFRKLVTTSCLSASWRRRWESVTGLAVDLPPSASARAIWRCAPPVHNFHANVHNHNRRRNFHRVARWLRALACKRVEQITLEFAGHEMSSAVFLGPGLFSCSALVRLYLSNCRMPPAPPGFPGFPKLVTLILDHVLLPFAGGGKQFEHLIEAAPDLGYLSLTDVGTKPLDDQGAAEIWVIRAPKLEELLIITNHEDNGCRIAELPLVEKASIKIDCLIGTQDFVDILNRISAVQELWVWTDLDPCTVNPLEGITRKFDNLTRAELNINFGVRPSFMSIVSLLRCSPNIEDIIIQAEDIEPLAGEFEITEVFLGSEISDDLFASLESVSLGRINNYSNQMCFMKFVLSKAKYLRHFHVSFDSGESEESYEQARAELKEYQKASPDTDMLMSLPPEILDIILVLVRTCCLSRAWRRRWESVPNLRIELPPRGGGSTGRALWLCAALIDAFIARVVDGTPGGVYLAARWLRAVARRRVRDLTLQFEPPSWLSSSAPRGRRRLLGPALFSCGAALVRLHLGDCHMPPAPRGFFSASGAAPFFPNLVSLTLDHVDLPFRGGGAQLELLIDAATRLAVLRLSFVYTAAAAADDDDHDDVEAWVIRAPICAEASVAGGGSNLLEGITWKFNNLREAQLCTRFGYHSSILSVVSLLKFAPHIESLHIMADETEWPEEDEIDEDSLNTQISNDLFAGLKVVLLTDVKISTNKVTFVYGDERNEWYVRACRELRECQKASPQAVFRPKFRDVAVVQTAVVFPSYGKMHYSVSLYYTRIDNGYQIGAALPKLEEAYISIDYLLRIHDFLHTQTSM
uniref:F-box domain-containing protein n=1 Tax=Leersia perrieri TaxID=77586 RepID=A0A0D9X635_9ORYZ